MAEIVDQSIFNDHKLVWKLKSKHQQAWMIRRHVTRFPQFGIFIHAFITF